jgi:hypothetical protein
MPSFGIGVADRPGDPRSARNIVRPRDGVSPDEVRARTRMRSATCASVDQIFDPFEHPNEPPARPGIEVPRDRQPGQRACKFLVYEHLIQHIAALAAVLLWNADAIQPGSGHFPHELRDSRPATRPLALDE